MRIQNNRKICTVEAKNDKESETKIERFRIFCTHVNTILTEVGKIDFCLYFMTKANITG